ncbi:hypothetical protein GSI_04349 [Ganoderma sinense ZZ0214-1]|uniref:Uncharacterized protein n=1 Tax=Ganoderma sinense ZZ0214-1 TaxID=1077348 RepID=A0A2G8SIY0_9APHY|nr:hypothetical protein GSI_04349 [Ganoderma sinense ZZ0214-1]
MSLTGSPVPSPTFNPQAYQEYAHQFQEAVVTVGLLGGLYGVLTVLALMSAYVLLTQHTRKIRRTTIVLCLTILALFTSTTIYTITSIIFYLSTLLNAVISSGGSLWSYSSPVDFSAVPPTLLQHSLATARLQACAGPATLTINVILGDAIVCWRACVVWHKNSLVKAVCGVFLLATFVVGVVDTTQSCRPPRSDAGNFTPERPSVGIAACVLSLSTNLLVTLLVAYKAWESRRRVRKILVVGPGSLHVQKIFSLFIESGVIYSAMWVLIVAFQISEFVYAKGGSALTPDESRFLGILNVVVHGILIPAIAIYPTVVIILVALGKAQVERKVMQQLESPTPPPLTRLVVNIETVTTTHYDDSSEVLVIGGHGDSGREVGVASGRTSEEQKAEPVV